MNQEQKIHSEYDEINLMDYIKVILRRKWLILSVFVLAIIAAGIFSFVSPKIYRAETILEIGHTRGAKIEALAQIVEKLELGVYRELIEARLDIPKNLKIESENPRGANFLIIKAESAEPKLAKTVLEEINNLISVEHQEKIKVEKELLEKDIERLKTKIASSEEEKKNIEAQIEILEKIPFEEQTLISQFVLFSTKERLEAKKQGIENVYLQISDFKRSLEDIRPTKVVKSPTISEEPIKPRLALNMSIAGILGIFFGTFLAFLQEFLQKNKTKATG
jgi:uncharacterized protein involved in exopolysaccharide biosynthesis